MADMCLQETFALLGGCSVCGPRDEIDLEVRSLQHGDEVVGEWEPERHDGVQASGPLTSGIVTLLLDNHSKRAAAWHLMREANGDRPPCVVTSEYAVRHLEPASSTDVCQLVARIVRSGDRWAKVEAHLESSGKVCASARGTFVVVEEGQPGFHRC